MMNSKRKSLLTVVLALFAASLLLAPVASAEFESEAALTDLEVRSNQKQSFKPSGGSGSTIECTSFAMDNALVSGSTWQTMTIEPTYGSCEDFLGEEVEIDENVCDYVFHLASSSTTGTVDVECPTSTGIQITVGSICTYEIDSQTGLGNITYTNTGTSTTREIIFEPNITSITSTRTTSDFPFLCPAGSSSGTYTGLSTVTGFSGSGHIGIFVD